MKLKLLLVLIITSSFFAAAQNGYAPGSFIIKGKVKNFKESFIDFGMTTYLDNYSNSIIVKTDGSFEQKFPVEKQQKIYLHLNKDVYLFNVLENDTLNLEWDENNFKNTFLIKGTSPVRTKNLQMQMNLYQELLLSVRESYQKLSNENVKLERNEKFILINELYNRNVKMVLDSSAGFFSESVNNMITGLYFQFTKLLLDERLLGQFELKITFDTKEYPFFDMANQHSLYKELNENWFWNVSEYRDFIYAYVRFWSPFSMYSINNSIPLWTTTPKTEPFNPTLQEYNKAQAYFYVTVIKDWFIVKTIMAGFGNYSFENVEKVYKLYINNCSTPYLKETLTKYYTAVCSLKPGNSSPGFSLKDERGKVISLNDFKGKVVYIDFWGVGCGPCIYEIKNHMPKLNQRYENKNIVFISICVDSNESQWKNGLKQYNIHGVNLIAEGWTKNPVCKAYNVTGIPHYVLIDKNGKITNNNAPRPSELDLDSGKNEIDLLLK
jgi:peroxiredoxin